MKITKQKLSKAIREALLQEQYENLPAIRKFLSREVLEEPIMSLSDEEIQYLEDKGFYAFYSKTSILPHLKITGEDLALRVLFRSGHKPRRMTQLIGTKQIDTLFDKDGKMTRSVVNENYKTLKETLSKAIYETLLNESHLLSDIRQLLSDGNYEEAVEVAASSDAERQLYLDYVLDHMAKEPEKAKYAFYDLAENHLLELSHESVLKYSEILLNNLKKISSGISYPLVNPITSVLPTHIWIKLVEADLTSRNLNSSLFALEGFGRAKLDKDKAKFLVETWLDLMDKGRIADRTSFDRMLRFLVNTLEGTDKLHYTSTLRDNLSTIRNFADNFVEKEDSLENNVHSQMSYF